MTTLEGEVIEGGWRYLCLGMLVQAVTRMKEEKRLRKNQIEYRLKGSSGLDKELIHQKAHAKDWIEGGVGLITFEECCETVGVDPGRAREKIQEYCARTWRRAR